ncbi:hypothetical protein 8UZL_00062 [Mycobacteroides phage 8UZL]|nr:hypothetical protein 8UZL_00062 [Mycobacteroides phage 8UZL]
MPDHLVPLTDDILKRLPLPTFAHTALGGFVLIIPPGHVPRARVGHARTFHTHLTPTVVVRCHRRVLRLVDGASHTEQTTEAAGVSSGDASPASALDFYVGDQRGAGLITDRPDPGAVQYRLSIRGCLADCVLNGSPESRLQGLVNVRLRNVEATRLQFLVVLQGNDGRFIGELRYSQQVLLD